MPEAGFALIAYAATAAGRVSSPDAGFSALQGSAARHSSRNNKPARPPSSALLRPFGCGVDRIGLIDRRRGREGRGARKQKEQETTTANIGTFKKNGKELQGEIVTLGVQARNVRVVPEANRPN